jgi:hypothetical protein
VDNLAAAFDDMKCGAGSIPESIEDVEGGVKAVVAQD